MRVILIGIMLVYLHGTVDSIPCCDNGELVRPGGFCGNGTNKVNIVCPIGFLPLRDIEVKGNKLYVKNAPNMVFASDPKDYCIGEMYKNRSQPGQGKVEVAIVCFQKDFVENKDIQISGILTLISVFFLLITFAVYMYLPQLRDIQGLCYMCLCVSMALGFLSLGLIQLDPSFMREICTATGFMVYFWMMATFFWMNVICINIYRTIVDAEYLKKTARKQYFIYNCYAWGCTMAFLIIALITNFVEGDHLKPDIGVDSCWFRDRVRTWLYFYGPVSVILAANVTLFTLSSFSLWKQTRKYEVSKLNNLRYKFLLCLKLMLVMGISWIFEIASFAHGESHIVWKIMDIFNCLQGLVIFIILVVLRRRAIMGLANAGIFLPITARLADKLSPHDDSDDQQILEDDGMNTEVRLH